MTEGSRTSGPSGAPGGWRGRVAGWLDSDLVGIPATLYTFLVLAISLAVFRLVGGFAGIIVAFGLWVPMVIFAIRGWGRPPKALEVRSSTAAGHRVLVIANRGLEQADVCDLVCRRGERAEAEALVLAPVLASSGLGDLADDVDAEVAAATRRVDEVVSTLAARGVRASGRADIADPEETLRDGLREIAANEVVIVPASERGWSDAEALVERVRDEAGLPVTVVGAASSDRDAV